MQCDIWHVALCLLAIWQVALVRAITNTCTHIYVRSSTVKMFMYVCVWARIDGHTKLLNRRLRVCVGGGEDEEA